jgi:hypothetical protein
MRQTDAALVFSPAESSGVECYGHSGYAKGELMIFFQRRLYKNVRSCFSQVQVFGICNVPIDRNQRKIDVMDSLFGHASVL